ncbi:phosphatase PAP2 family protein [Hymenobacter seoulensis]
MSVSCWAAALAERRAVERRGVDGSRPAAPGTGASPRTGAGRHPAQVRKPCAGHDGYGPPPVFVAQAGAGQPGAGGAIGYGASTINGNGLYSSYDAQRDVRHLFGSYRNSVDDYLQFAPYAVLGGLVAAGVETRDDRLNLLLVIAKSEAIMLGLVFLIKTTAGILRPDSSARNSFASGHMAQAFLAASIVHTELRGKSPWYGIGAYTLVTSVGVFRMINNKHWQSDVVAGAGFGILSVHLG